MYHRPVIILKKMINITPAKHWQVLAVAEVCRFVQFTVIMSITDDTHNNTLNHTHFDSDT